MVSDIRVKIGFTGCLKYRISQAIIGDGLAHYLINLWGYTAQNYPLGKWTGNPDEMMGAVEIVCDWRGETGKLLKVLIDKCWIDVDSDGISIHDWEKHQMWVIGAEAREAKAIKAAKSRWGLDDHATSNATSNATSMLQAMPHTIPNQTNSISMPYQTNHITDKDKEHIVGQTKPDGVKELRDRIIDDLNEVLKSGYKHNSQAIVRLLNGRIKEGHTFEDFQLVHRGMSYIWGTINPTMATYLRPQTLYNGKFSNYLEQSKALAKNHNLFTEGGEPCQEITSVELF